jgi:hypothetical protein
LPQNQAQGAKAVCTPSPSWTPGPVSALSQWHRPQRGILDSPNPQILEILSSGRHVGITGQSQGTPPNHTGRRPLQALRLEMLCRAVDSLRTSPRVNNPTLYEQCRSVNILAYQPSRALQSVRASQRAHPGLSSGIETTRPCHQHPSVSDFKDSPVCPSRPTPVPIPPVGRRHNDRDRISSCEPWNVPIQSTRDRSSVYPPRTDPRLPRELTTMLPKDPIAKTLI